jgi:hypothetical protein
MDYEINPESAVLDILERTLQVAEKHLRAIYPELQEKDRSIKNSWYEEQIFCASCLVAKMRDLKDSISIYHNRLNDIYIPDPPDFLAGDLEEGEIPDIPF